MKATLKNTGTRDLSDIRIVVEPQTDWQEQISPEFVPSLKRQEEQEIQILLIPPIDVTPGDYEAKMKENERITKHNTHIMEYQLSKFMRDMEKKHGPLHEHGKTMYMSVDNPLRNKLNNVKYD